MTRRCKCGCGGQPKRGNFLPGHDARYYAMLRRGQQGDERYERMHADFEDELCAQIDALVSIGDESKMIKESVRLWQLVEKLDRMGVIAGEPYYGMITRRINQAMFRKEGE